jgi:hypothetical protein
MPYVCNIHYPVSAILLIGCVGSVYRGFAGILYVYYVIRGIVWNQPDTNALPGRRIIDWTHSVNFVSGKFSEVRVSDWRRVY